MDFNDFKEFIKNAQRGQPTQINLPTSVHMSFIPQEQRSNSLLMVSKVPQKQHMPTCFIGTIRANYTQQMWQEDIEKWKQHLGTPQQAFYEIPLIPVMINGEILDMMDSTDAIPKIETALKAINNMPVNETIRLICLGTGHCSFLYEAITYLLREWKEPNGNLRSFTAKQMQFITSGDTKDRDMSNFCQWLVISGACHLIEFYNTMTYHPFGCCSSEYKQQR